MQIQISDSTSIRNKISKLTADSQPVFGQMSAQHMLEHLGFTLMISTGIRESKLYVSPENAALYKEKLLTTDMKMPRGFKAPMLNDTPPPLKFNSFEKAADFLQNQLDWYFLYVAKNPDAIHMHPTLGKLNMNEWYIFHNKHFTHHFEQFGLFGVSV